MKLTGFYPAVFTPFDGDGRINVDIIPEYASKLQKDGNKGAFVGGTTGEGLLLSVEERKILAEAWIKEQISDFKIIIHVGANSLVDATALAAHAGKIGANGFSAMAPAFLKPGTVEGLLSFVRPVAAAVPDMPFYYYHIPQVTGVDLSMTDFLDAAGKEVPNLKGIKYSGTDLMDNFLTVNHDGGKWDVLYGQDEKWLAGMSLGMRGAIGSTYNYMTPVYLQLIEAFDAGNLEEARRLQLKSARLVRLMDRYGGGIRVGKRLMKAVGIDCGELRAPGISMTEEEWREVEEEVRGYIGEL